MQHLLKADGGNLLVAAVPLEVDHGAADELPDSDGRESAAASHRADGDGRDDTGGQSQLGSGRVTEPVEKLDLSRLHGRGTIARVRQLTRLAEVHPLLPYALGPRRCLLVWYREDPLCLPLYSHMHTTKIAKSNECCCRRAASGCWHSKAFAGPPSADLLCRNTARTSRWLSSRC